jgi:hypothetical protein
MTREHVTINLQKVQPSTYYVRLRFRELWKAWRHGINLPARRVSPTISFSAGTTEAGITTIGGGGGGYGGNYIVPEGVTSINIEEIGGGGGEYKPQEPDSPRP